MADTKDGRENQADEAERRQRERELAEARARADEAEPSADEGDEGDEGNDDAPIECHRRGCTELAAFVVRERYQEEGGHGAVEAVARLCPAHATEESPTNLDGAYSDYVFRVDPIPERVTDRP